MNPTQSVVFTSIVGFTIFVMAGNTATNKTRNGLRNLRGLPPTTPKSNAGPDLSVPVATGWATLFLMLIIFTDVPATAPVAAGFGWLILLSLFLIFGVDAFNNINYLNGQASSTAFDKAHHTTPSLGG